VINGNSLNGCICHLFADDLAGVVVAAGQLGIKYLIINV
jgi:hypothetical protein